MALNIRRDASVASAAALAIGAALVGTSRNAEAAVVWSGIVNINIPSTTDGVYLNVLTGQAGASGASVAGWDVNLFGINGLAFFAPVGGGFMAAGGTSALLVDNLAYETEIGASQSFTNYPSTNPVEISGSTSMNLLSSENLVGFRFINEGTGQAHYGWMRIQFTGETFTQPRAIVEYAFEDVAGASLLAGTIPAPGALSLLGAAALISRRRRR